MAVAVLRTDKPFKKNVCRRRGEKKGREDGGKCHFFVQRVGAKRGEEK